MTATITPIKPARKPAVKSERKSAVKSAVKPSNPITLADTPENQECHSEDRSSKENTDFQGFTESDAQAGRSKSAIFGRDSLREAIGVSYENDVDTDFSENNNKKRGRKPRGGKLILRNIENANTRPNVSNVILHLKCSMHDLSDYNTTLSRMMTDPLEYNPDVPPEILTYNNIQGFTSFEETARVEPSAGSYTQLCKCCMLSTATHEESETDTTNIKDINQKLKTLKIQLYKNAIQSDKKAACFWCTYDFDNTACLIPKYEMDETIYGYGSFCRPECAVAYLMKENIDDSTKFERYQLLNQIYSKVYECKKNIKPAPNPYYLLDKYYGNLTIQEYRKLLKTEHLMLVIDKPLTRILPELHEDNEDMIMNIYGINKSTDAVSGVYKVKRQSEKQQGPSKASIIRNKFGLS